MIVNVIENVVVANFDVTRIIAEDNNEVNNEMSIENVIFKNFDLNFDVDD